MTTATIALPAELAPTMRQQVVDLLAQVHLVCDVPALDPALRREPAFNRCSVCHRSGTLGTHHDDHGHVVWVHRSCHRRLHRRNRGSR